MGEEKLLLLLAVEAAESRFADVGDVPGVALEERQLLFLLSLEVSESGAASLQSDEFIPQPFVLLMLLLLILLCACLLLLSEGLEMAAKLGLGLLKLALSPLSNDDVLLDDLDLSRSLRVGVQISQLLRELLVFFLTGLESS